MDPYAVLGVDKKATQEQISKAYRTLAAKYHPDRNPDDSSQAVVKFKEVTTAWEMIGDEDKRRRHDFYGRSASTFSFRSRNSVDDVFDNLFSQFFGGPFSPDSALQRLRVKITLAEAYHGCSKAIKSEGREPCSTCTGTGSASWSRCAACGGSGFVVVGDEPTRVQSACVSCAGRGSTPEQSCSACNGRGYKVVSERNLDINIPRGIEDGTQIRLPNGAHDGKDIFVVVNVERDPTISRQNKNLFLPVEVSYATLVLGGEASAVLFGEEIVVKIPKGTRSGSRFRLAGRGMPHIQNSSLKGDLFIDLALKVPTNPSKEYEDLLKALAKIETQS
jgi:molecular chaperone DnaJ